MNFLREQHDKQQTPREWWGRRRMRSRMKRKSVMFRGHTRCFFLINSNVRKNKPVLILPSILYFILFCGGLRRRRAGNMRAAVLCYVDGRGGPGVPVEPASRCCKRKNKHSPTGLFTQGVNSNFDFILRIVSPTLSLSCLPSPSYFSCSVALCHILSLVLCQCLTWESRDGIRENNQTRKIASGAAKYDSVADAWLDIW